MIHYAPLDWNVACGRTGTSLQSSPDASQISCKLCLRSVEKATAEPVRKSPSLAELRAAAKASAPTEAAASAKAAALAGPAPAKAAKPAAKSAASLSARAEWQKRLAQLPGKNRLPRGMAAQGFI